MQEQNKRILGDIKNHFIIELRKYSDQDILNFFSSKCVLRLEKSDLHTLSNLYWINNYLFKSCHYKLMMKWVEGGNIVFLETYINLLKSVMNINTTEENLYLIIQILITINIRFFNYCTQGLKAIENIIVNMPNFDIQSLKFKYPKSVQKNKELTELLLAYTKNITKETITFLELNNFSIQEPERFLCMFD